MAAIHYVLHFEGKVNYLHEIKIVEIWLHWN